LGVLRYGTRVTAARGLFFGRSFRHRLNVNAMAAVAQGTMIQAAVDSNLISPCAFPRSALMVDSVEEIVRDCETAEVEVAMRELLSTNPYAKERCPSVCQKCNSQR
jgi:hypothetical protein